MDAVSQTTLSNAFSWMKMLEFWFEISLKFVPKGSINNIPALVQIMAWCRSGDKPWSEPMMVSLLTHICVTRPQWVKACESCFGDRMAQFKQSLRYNEILVTFAINFVWAQGCFFLFCWLRRRILLAITPVSILERFPVNWETRFAQSD